MNQLPNIDAAVYAIKVLTPAKRKAAIQAILKEHPDPTTSEGRALLHRRALFCTRLGTEKLWPER